MLEGSIFRGLISMTIPIMVMNVLQSLFSIIDMTVLGVMVDDNAVGAVGASSTLITLTTGLLIGIGTSATVVVAKHLGRQEEIDTDKAVGTSILFSIVGGVSLMVIGLIFAKTFLVWTNCPESLLADAVLYFRIYFCAVPFIMLYNFSAAIPTVCTLFYMCLFRFVWIYVFFPLCPNMTFLYLVWPIGWILQIATTLVFLFPTVKKLNKKYQKEPQYET